MIEFSELVIHVAHTPRTRASAGAPPLGEGARSLWAVPLALPLGQLCRLWLSPAYTFLQIYSVP